MKTPKKKKSPPKTLGLSPSAQVTKQFTKKAKPRVLITMQDIKRCKQSERNGNAEHQDFQIAFDKESQCSITFKTTHTNTLPSRISEPLRKIHNGNDDPLLTNQFLAGANLVIGYLYFDTVKRLKLNDVHDCARDALYCYENHKFNDQGNSNIDHDDYIFMAMDDSNILEYVQLTQLALSSGQFPCGQLLRFTLDVILLLHVPSSINPAILATDVIAELILTFMSIIDNFPICVAEHQQEYKRAIIGIPAIDSRFYDRSYAEGFFKYVIGALKDCMNSPAEQAASHVLSRQDSDDFDVRSYRQWEKDCDKNRFNWNGHSRTHKIHRLLYVLKICVTIFEREACYFIHRHPRSLLYSLFDVETRPILACILWPDVNMSNFDKRYANDIFRDIIQCFITAIYLNYPDDDIDVLARLLHMCAVYSEFAGLLADPATETVEYLNEKPGFYCEKMAKELRSIIEDHSNLDTNCIIKIIKYCKHPILKYHISSQLMKRYSSIGLGNSPEAKSFYVELIRRKWEKLPDDQIEMHLASEEECENPYPDKRLKIQKSAPDLTKITKQQYLDMIFVCFQGLLDTYDFVDFVEFIKTPDGSEPREIYMETGSFIKPLFEASTGSCSELSMPVRPKTLNKYFFDGIAITKDTFNYYREAMKHLSLLGKFVAEEYKKYPERFGEWKELTHSFCTNQYK